MSQKHTPGPWHVGKRVFIPYIYGPKGEEVAGPSNFTSGHDETMANSLLISAAPDLLGALIGMVNKYGDKSQFPTCDASISARAAISKAEGNK